MTFSSHGTASKVSPPGPVDKISDLAPRLMSERQPWGLRKPAHHLLIATTSILDLELHRCVGRVPELAIHVALSPHRVDVVLVQAGEIEDAAI